jgi:hypothetical protein
LSQSGASDLELDAYGKTTYKYEKTGKYWAQRSSDHGNQSRYTCWVRSDALPQ